MALTLSNLRKLLADMDAPELREVIEELFKASAANKRLLTAKLEGDNSELLDKLLTELEKAFRTEGRLPTMRVGDAKKALAAYAKAATPTEALDAHLRFVEAGARCLRAYGGWPDNNYTSMQKVFEKAFEYARKLNPDDLPYDRFRNLADDHYLELRGYYNDFLDELDEQDEEREA